MDVQSLPYDDYVKVFLMVIGFVGGLLLAQLFTKGFDKRVI